MSVRYLFFCLQALSAPVLSAVGERYYKVTAEALRVCGELVRVVRPRIEVCICILFDLELMLDPVLKLRMAFGLAF